MEDYLENKLGLQIWTDSGWSDFEGLLRKGIEPVVDVTTEDNLTITCTPDHKIYKGCMEPQEAKNLCLDDNLITIDGLSKVKSVSKRPDAAAVYDIVGVEKHSRFYANDILISNCEFIIFDETLINAIKLAGMEGIDPLFKLGEVRWYKKPSIELMYVLALDPSIGTGGDNAAIQVIELPTMVQVGEWYHNQTIPEGQVQVLKDITDYLYEYGVRQIYWSVENNTVGEAILTVIRDTGEENFHGEFLTEPKSTRAAGSKSKGFHTGSRNKIEACAYFKKYVEHDQLQVRSKALISEMKTFVARGNTYKAKPGAKDDIVMSMIIAVRMIKYISQFEDDVYDVVNSSILDRNPEEDFEAPMPFSIL